MTTDILTDALHTIPGYADACDTLDRIAHARDQLATGRDVKVLQDQILTEVEANVMAGAKVPDDLGERLTAAAQVLDHDQAARQAIRIFEGRAEAHRDHVVKSGRDHALTFLAGHLDELLSDVRTAHRTCKGITTADQALRAGDEQVTAWRVLEAAPRRYDALRLAQFTFVSGPNRPDPGPPAALIAKAGLYRNIEDFHPVWRERLHPGSVLTGGRQELQQTDAPWPAPAIEDGGISKAIWPTADPIAFLRWLAYSPKVDVWLPTMDDLQARSDELDQAIRKAATDRGQRQTFIVEPNSKANA